MIVLDVVNLKIDHDTTDMQAGLVMLCLLILNNLLYVYVINTVTSTKAIADHQNASLLFMASEQKVSQGINKLEVIGIKI
jgi:hypothetical protein